jgi:tetratricopeptide (TPR) repeat protein
MSRRTCAASVLALSVALVQLPGGANGVPAPPPPSASAPRTPESMAVEAYNKGLDNRNRGLKAEEQAAKAAKDSDRVRHEKKAREEFERALKNFEQAAAHNPELPQAWNGMGYASRKLGNFANALDSYDRALRIAPNFPDAIEYRAEAYLALNRIEDAKQAYLTLFAIDRKQAELLMKAMQAWVSKRKADPAGADSAAVADLETWIRERTAIAQQTRLMGRDTTYRSW